MTGAIYHGREREHELDLDCDVVVVGSGAGGAVVACHLAEAGQDTIILEEGGHVTPQEHALMRPSQSLRHLWREAGLTMALGIGDTPMINVMMGRCVGGSSVLTGGVCFRIPESVLSYWNRERELIELTPETLEPFYQDVEQTVHVETVPVEMQSRSTRLFGIGASKMGYGIHPMRRNTKGCIGWSTCNFGCPEGAKRSVDTNYIPRAIQAGARLYSDCLVERVSLKGDSAAGVEGRILNGKKGDPFSRLTVRARRVVIAAGGYHSPLILLRSGIGKRDKQVGRHLTLHPGFRIMARFREPVEGSRGAMQSAFSVDFDQDNIQLNGLFIPGGTLVAALPGIGTSHRRRAEQIPYLAIFGANLHDQAGGRVRRGIGREPFVYYKMSPRDRTSVRLALQIAADTFFAAGAVEVFLPVIGLDGLSADAFRTLDLSKISMRRLECSSQHPLGTCRMGTSPQESVIDPNGQTWDVKELYVADGAAVPSSLGVNPQLAIMTLATRLAYYLREKPFVAR